MGENNARIRQGTVDTDANVGSGAIEDLTSQGFAPGTLGFPPSALSEQQPGASILFSRLSGRTFQVMKGLGSTLCGVQLMRSSGVPANYPSRVLSPVIVGPGLNWSLLATDTSPIPPTMPAAPVFAGAVLTVGAAGMFLTVSAAFAAAAIGDIIEILAGETITEVATISLNKSVEIRGQNRATCMVTGAINGPLFSIPPGQNNVYLHDMIVRNTSNVADTNVPISAQTVNTANPNGSTGLYFKSLTLQHTEFGIVIGGNGWVIDDCSFEYFPPAGAADTHRHIGNYQTVGNCFVNNCVFFCTPEATPRSIAVLLTNVQYDFITPATTGHTGNFVLSNCSQSGGNMRQFVVQEWFKQPGLNAAPITLGAFSFWSFNNVHGATSGGSHIFFEGSTLVAPMDFFSVVYLSNDTCGLSTGKGLLAIDGAGGPGRAVGTPAGGLWAPVPNTIGDPVVGPTWADGCTTANLVGVRTSIYAVPAPLIPVATPGSQAPPEVAAILNPTQGAIVAQTPTSGPAFLGQEMTQLAGPDPMSPLNLVLIRSATTGEPLLSAGRRIFGLLQIESTGVNGEPFNDTTARGKLSFVCGNATQTGLEPCPAADIQGQSIQYQYVRRQQSTFLPQFPFQPTGF